LRRASSTFGGREDIPGLEKIIHDKTQEVVVMLMRFDPFRELDRLTRQVWGQTDGWQAVMPMDAYRRDDRFTVHFDLPGVDPGSIEATVESNELTVRAERSWQPGEGDEVIVSERPQGRFSRQVFLGEDLDTEHIEASYDHGVLTVTIPVAEQAKPRKIVITRGGGKPMAIEAEQAAA
jgi:HSP20 family protein